MTENRVKQNIEHRRESQREKRDKRTTTTKTKNTGPSFYFLPNFDWFFLHNNLETQLPLFINFVVDGSGLA